jgi:hypothetical protein
MSDQPPGWYPNSEGQMQWWDGSAWGQLQEPSAPAGAPMPPPPPVAGYGAAPYGQQQPYAQQPRAVGADNAGGALAASIGGLLCCAPVAIVGLVMGNNAKNEAEATGRPLDGTMKAARIVAIVALALWAAGIVIYAIALAAASGS